MDYEASVQVGEAEAALPAVMFALFVFHRVDIVVCGGEWQGKE